MKQITSQETMMRPLKDLKLSRDLKVELSEDEAFDKRTEKAQACKKARQTRFKLKLILPCPRCVANGTSVQTSHQWPHVAS